MVLNKKYIIEEIKRHKIKLTGVLHIGAHECEEKSFYNKDLHINNKNIIWIEANPTKVEEAKNKGIKNIYQAVITNEDDKELIFNVANNFQSSSVLELGTHATEHPDIKYVKDLSFKATTITVKSFFKRNNILHPEKYNFWNFDIQGAELMALQGAKEYIKYAKVINLEVNTEKVYKDCPLMSDIDAYLSKYNFQRVLTKITKHGWGDALYIKTNNNNTKIKTYEDYKKLSKKNYEKENYEN
jgi:FkbM family methyltransferase